MNLGQLIEQIRSLTVEALQTAAAQHDSGRVRSEQALCDADGAPVTDGTLGLPTRVDLTVLDPDGTPTETVAIRTKSMTTFDPVRMEWDGGMDILVHPFQWDQCGLRVGRLPADPDWTALTRWFLRRFVADGENAPLGVVHFLSEPVALEQGGFALTLDFGTAPADAFGELLEAVSKTGAKALIVGRPVEIGAPA